MIIELITINLKIEEKKDLMNVDHASFAGVGDLQFPRTCPLADYDSCWVTTFNDRTLINLTACYESTVLFAAREGWISSSAPSCMKESCQGRTNSSYRTKRNDSNKKRAKSCVWRFRCCGA